MTRLDLQTNGAERRDRMSPDREAIEALRIDRDRGPRRRRWPMAVLVVAALVLFAAGAAFALWRIRPTTVPVRTVVVRVEDSGADRTLLNASGYVTARREATVSSKVTGKVVEVLVEEGMRVEEGQVLARLDSSNVEMSLHLAEAQLRSARQGPWARRRPTSTRPQRELLRCTNELATRCRDAARARPRRDRPSRSLSARLERQAATSR